MKLQHRIQFPPADSQSLSQDEVHFFVHEDQQPVKLRFHDYGEIYDREGLYEQLFYDRLKCCSPETVGEILKETIESTNQHITELRVLDFGAGNGMMGEVLKKHGVARLIGVDILEEAKQATDRDRPGIYDDYYVCDFTDLKDDEEALLEEWSFNCLTTVAALGFGDIPPLAFYNALRFVKTGGWVAFNIKETFLDYSDQSGFSRMIRELIFSEYLEVFHLVKYRHRLSMEGTPLFYYALVGRKTADIPQSFVEEIL